MCHRVIWQKFTERLYEPASLFFRIEELFIFYSGDGVYGRQDPPPPSTTLVRMTVDFSKMSVNFCRKHSITFQKTPFSQSPPWKQQILQNKHIFVTYLTYRTVFTDKISLLANSRDSRSEKSSVNSSLILNYERSFPVFTEV